MSHSDEIIKQNLNLGFETVLSYALDVSVIKTDTLSRMESSLTSGIVNRVMDYKPSSTVDLVAEIQAIASTYRKRGVPCCWSTFVEDEVTEAALTANKFEKVSLDPGMLMSLESWVYEDSGIPGLELREVRTQDELDSFRHLMQISFGMPDIYVKLLSPLDTHIDAKREIRHYLSYMDGQPVATVTSILKNGVVGIYSVTTAEPYRRKGVAEALTNYALREAHVSGAKLAILQAGSPGAASLYRKLGFREEISIATYVG